MTHTAERLIQLKRKTALKNSSPMKMKNASPKPIALLNNLAYSQRDWTNSIDKMKFNQLVDEAAEKFELAHNISINCLLTGKNLYFAVSIGVTLSTATI